jgi:hypothetical protein
MKCGVRSLLARAVRGAVVSRIGGENENYLSLFVVFLCVLVRTPYEATPRCPPQPGSW